MDEKESKKTIWTMLIIVVILAIIVTILYIPKEMGFSALTCNELLEENILIIDSANYCSNNNDCMISTDIVMHICGCYELINKNVNLEEIKNKGTKINAFYLEKNCSMPLCEPCSVPSKESIRCINNKCVLSN